MSRPIELTGPGDTFHEAGVFVAKQVLVERGWNVLPLNDRWRHESTGLLPDLIAERWGPAVRRKLVLIVEVETGRRSRAMAERERYYTDTFPPKADRFAVVPLYQLRGKARDSLRAIREVVDGALP